MIGNPRSKRSSRSPRAKAPSPKALSPKANQIPASYAKQQPRSGTPGLIRPFKQGDDKLYLQLPKDRKQISINDSLDQTHGTRPQSQGTVIKSRLLSGHNSQISGMLTRPQSQGTLLFKPRILSSHMQRQTQSKSTLNLDIEAQEPEQKPIEQFNRAESRSTSAAPKYFEAKRAGRESGSQSRSGREKESTLIVPLIAQKSASLKIVSVKIAQIFHKIQAIMKNLQVDLIVQTLKMKNVLPKIIDTVFELQQMILDCGDSLLFCYALIFSADILLQLGEQDKALFFYNQCRLVTDWINKLSFLKPKLFAKMGDVCLNYRDISLAIKIFKRGLQYAWYHNNTDDELMMYQKIGIGYYYMFDIQLSNYYHNRSVLGDIEVKESIDRRLGVQILQEYFQKKAYNEETITHFLLAHLTLNVKLDYLFEEGGSERLKEQQKNQKVKLDLFYKINSYGMINNIREDKEFNNEIDTPKFSFRQVNQHIFSRLKKEPTFDPIVRKKDDDSKLGIMDCRYSSDRKFSDIEKYKLPSDVIVKLRLTQKFDPQQAIDNAHTKVNIVKKFIGDKKFRTRVSHMSGNRQSNQAQFSNNKTQQVIDQFLLQISQYKDKG